LLDSLLQEKSGFKMPTTITASTKNISESKYDIELSNLALLPRGEPNITHAVLTQPDGSEYKIFIWRENEKRYGLDAFMLLLKSGYCCNIGVSDDFISSNEPMVVTVNKEDKIEEVNPGKINFSFKFLDLLGGRVKAPNLIISCYLALHGWLTQLPKLLLCVTTYDNTESPTTDHLAPEDVVEAVPLLSLTSSLEISGLSFTAEQWRELENKIREGAERFEWSSDELWGVTLSKGSGAILAKLCSKVKVVRLENVVYEDFGEFLTNLEKCLGEEGAKCEKITFAWNDNIKNPSALWNFEDMGPWDHIRRPANVSDRYNEHGGEVQVDVGETNKDDLERLEERLTGWKCVRDHSSVYTVEDYHRVWFWNEKCGLTQDDMAVRN